MVHWIEQVLGVSAYNLRTVPQRIGSVLAAMFGIAGVVAVFVGVLSIGVGFQAAMTGATSDDTAIVLRGGSTSELVSGLSREQTRIIAEAPGVMRGVDGPLASPELFLILNLPRRSTGTDANVPMRGVEQAAFEVRDGLRVIEGRGFEWGRAEVIVGRGAAREFTGLEVGGTLEVAGQPWEVVGVFESAGGIEESEIWGDARLLQSVYHRGDTFQSVLARMQSVDSFPAFRDELVRDPRVEVNASRTSDYYAGQSALITGLITGLGTLVAALMGLGATFGALNTMYNSVSSRTREIATLRALGFTAGPVVLAILAESVLLALLGGAGGGLFAWAAFDGLGAATMNWQSFSQVAFAFQVTPSLLIQGIFYATVIGLLGGLFPAIRAARMPVADALRS